MTGEASSPAGAAAAVSTGSTEISTFLLLVALACLVWYTFIVLVQTIGFTQLNWHYSSNPVPAASSKVPSGDLPHITILRPVKGLEPQLYECLASSFRLSYPREKLTIYLCVSSSSDPAYPVLKRLLEDFPDCDAKLFVEDDDPNLSGNGGEISNLGPNPKIRNMSRGYREAKGDIIWVMDCNVWVAKGTAGRMIDKLCGYLPNGKRTTPYKFVHQLPLVVDSVGISVGEEARGLLSRSHPSSQEVSSSSTAAYDISLPPANESTSGYILRSGGGRLEEMFMASTHAKFYTAINTVSVAPCIVGKSNMFRRSHLDALTATSTSYSPGIDFFSSNICEDHLIGDLLWKKSVPAEIAGEKWGRHALVFGDLAIQPMAGMSIREYVARRVRWLRVRKWTVTLATFIEPGVESFLCSAYGAFAFTTLPWFRVTAGIPNTWTVFAIFWCLSVLAWVTVDWFTYMKLNSCASVEQDEDTPSFARPPRGGQRRPFGQWIAAWLGREILALPIWIVAIYGGTTVVWRSKTFWVGLDMTVYEIQNKGDVSEPTGQNGTAMGNKPRRD